MDRLSGLSADVQVWMLPVYEAEGFRELGVAVDDQLQPDAADAAEPNGARGAIVGRTGDERD